MTICVSLCIWECVIVANKAISKDSFQIINELRFDKLIPPTITICPGEAWKVPGPFINDEQFMNSIYSPEEIFHPKTLRALRNESLFVFKQQYSSYYGMCFVLQKLTAEKISDYSFQIVINNSMDYNYYLHEPLENEWLLLSVYPYEVNVNHIDANNDDGIGGADIIYQKNIVRKIPGKGGCQDKTLNDTIECWKEKLAHSLEGAHINCMIPLLRFTRYDPINLTDCTNKDEALAVENIIYKEAQNNLAKNVCGNLCRFTNYEHKLAFLPQNVLCKEIKIYGDGYFIIWNFYSSLYVNEKVETYVFDVNFAVYGIGGSLGLFLGWNIKSIVESAINFFTSLCYKTTG